MKKYRMTDETRYFSGSYLHRIEAIRDFNGIKAGEKGGFIESERNLSHGGNCWVADDAMVAGAAFVHQNALIKDRATVFMTACVFGDAIVSDCAAVMMSAFVSGHSYVRDFARIMGNAQITADATVAECALVCENATILGNAVIRRDARVERSAEISTGGLLESWKDYACVDGFGSAGDHTTFYRNIDGGISVTYGFRHGKIEEFRKYVKDTYGDTKEGREYLEIADLMERHLMEK